MRLLIDVRVVKPNGAMQQAQDPATERGLRPQPAATSSVPDGKC